MLLMAASCCRAAGDDVDKKKPDPTIYKVAATRLGVAPGDCVVVEDSTIGLQAALGAGMRCIITYTPSTKSQVRAAHGMAGMTGVYTPKE
jgi:beta-phosphoglucomutase-like phosphatase (HAD superfamily)